MTTSIDTNILLDIFLPDPTHGEKSLQSLEKAYSEGALVICNIVYAELAPQFDDRELLDSSLEKMGIEIVTLNNESAYMAGRLWKVYRKNAATRDRIITDFLIGAFSATQTERLLTRDRGFYRTYFKDLKMVQASR